MNNILIILPNDSLGGAEQYLKMLASHFLNQNYSVYVFFFKRKVSGSWDDLGENNKLHLIYTNSTSEKNGVLTLFKNLILYRFTFFTYTFTSHVHCTSLVGILMKFNIIKTKYFIARESTSIFKRFKNVKLLIFKLQYFLGYHSVDLLICQTYFMKEQLTKALPWLARKIKIRIIPNPVNLEQIEQQSNNPSFSNLAERYIVSAGRLIKIKGFDLLIEAFDKLRNKNIHLVILGEGEERTGLEKLITELGLSNRVHLLGFKNNVYPYFRNAEMCVVSSLLEGFPNVLLQMMSQNTKVVSTLCAGDIEKLEGVFTCVVSDVRALADTMDQCLVNDTTKNRELFDNELNNRSINMFIDKIMGYLHE